MRYCKELSRVAGAAGRRDPAKLKETVAAGFEER
jgi:hypothetical protein